MLNYGDIFGVSCNFYLSATFILILEYEHTNILTHASGFPQSWKILENPGKKSGHGKVMENSKNSECHGNLFARKKVMEKSWKSVVQICLIIFLLCCDQCGSRLYSSVSLITTIVLHLCYTYT